MANLEGAERVVAPEGTVATSITAFGADLLIL